jgi:hypothetical protein
MESAVKSCGGANFRRLANVIWAANQFHLHDSSEKS